MYQPLANDPNAPPQAGYPAYQGGYQNPGQPGYPAPAQGYPGQGAPQGYPPQGQPGYPPQGQPGYPPQGQPGYPPQGQPGYPPNAPPAEGSIPKYAGEMPEHNVKDDPNFKEPDNAWVPPTEAPQSLPGYANLGYEEVPSAPPPSYDELPKEPPTREPVAGAVSMSEDEVRAALLEHVGQFCCYRKGPAEDMQFQELQPSSAFHYKLESYCEGRSTKWESEPYHGQPLVMTGPPPGPWDMQVNMPEMFKESKLKMEVPNTAYVKPCHSCHGRGYKRCMRCHGRGQVECSFCHGNGERTDASGESSRCHSCSGDGHRRCISCHGHGQTQCHLCKGSGSLRWFIQLTVKWKNHDSDKVVENSVIPNKLIEKATGETALKETAPRVWPINHFPHQEINQASQSYVTEHTTKFPTERMLMQQQTVRIVPITTVTYKLSDDTGTFWVYGKEHKVHFPDYPAQCCCTIL